jgi:hypothetical protein
MAERFHDWLGEHSDELLRRVNLADQRAHGSSARAAHAHAALSMSSVELLHALRRDQEPSTTAALWAAMRRLCEIHVAMHETQASYAAELETLRTDVATLRADAFKQLASMRVPLMTCGPAHSSMHAPANVRDDGRIN